MQTSPLVLQIPEAILERMLNHAAQEAPNEACGLLAGEKGSLMQGEHFFPAVNQLASPVEFRMDPVEQLALFNKIEDLGCELLAICHSHPNGPPHPSKADLAAHLYPDVCALILYNGDSGWGVKTFLIDPQGATEIHTRLA